MRESLLILGIVALLAAGTAVAGPAPGGADTDGDTVEDAFDNCTGVVNASQTDADHDGCGDACTQNIACDANGDTSVGSVDFNILRMNFGMSVPTGTLGDCSPEDALVGSTDFNALRMQFGNTVGPSGITTAQCDPSSCRCSPQ